MNGLTRRSQAHLEQQMREQRIAEMKAAEKQFRDEVVEHFLYRCFDAEGRLLYIGCTQDVEARMAVHHSQWQNPASAYLNLHMDRYEVEGPFVGRVAGRKAEREAIEAEAPLLNLHHNKGRGLPRVPVTPPTAEDMAKVNEALSALFKSRGVNLGGAA